jgi:signal transduction histidine kinase
MTMAEGSKNSPKYKHRLLMTKLYYLVIATTLLYAFLDRLVGIFADTYIYIAVLIFGIVNLILLKRGYVELSKYAGLLVFNAIILFLASSEPFNTGMHLQFVTAGAVALAVFGFEQWKEAIGFVLLSLVLNIVVFKTDISLLPYRDVTNEQANIFFILNTVIAAAVSVYTILLISKINYESEHLLQQNELLIQKQNEQLRKTNDELDRFVYSASHDLRAPLSTLLGLISLIKDENDEIAKQKYYDLMVSRIHSMETFISEIIDYSRNTRAEVLMQDVNLKHLIDEVIEELRYMPNFDTVSIINHIPESLTLRSDNIRLKVVITNLISNGVKYADFNKNEKWIKVEALTEEGSTIISFSDNGVGIDADHHQEVFEMFHRAHEHSSGSGLGLYIVKETIDKLSAKISLKSIPYQGSTFTIEFPYNSIDS